jgi:tetratricopeptide (TPR) repeat protein
MKNLIYSCILFTALSTLTISCRNSFAGIAKATELLPRTETVGKSEEWQNIQNLYTTYKAKLDKDTADIDTRLKLIALYLNEARIVGNQQHYYRLAMLQINNVLNNANNNTEYMYAALTNKANVLLSLHQFEAAQKLAKAAVLLNPSEADVYGALIDANVELGNYKDAVMYCDKMLTIRPDLRSYSRASYIRQIAGDTTGAIIAMQMAVDAGAAGAENTEWARVNLGDLYLNKGVIDTAQYMFETALANRPNYAQAQMGLARLATYTKNYTTAIMHCTNAINIISESSFVNYLATIHQANGDTVKAIAIKKEVLQLLIQAEQENVKETLIKHNGNRELAQAYLDNKDYNNALKFAVLDAKIRPNNIDANQLLYKIYVHLNNNKEAQNTQACINNSLQAFKNY